MKPLFTAKCEKCGKTVYYFLIEASNKSTKEVLNVCAECATDLISGK